MVGAGFILPKEPAPLECIYGRNAAQAPTTFWNLRRSQGDLAPFTPGTCTADNGDLHRHNHPLDLVQGVSGLCRISGTGPGPRHILGQLNCVTGKTLQYSCVLVNSS